MLIGRQFVADAMGWKASTAWERLLKLQAWEMISLKSDSRGTLLTVCQWESYQICENDSRQPSDNQPTTEQQPTDSGPTHSKKHKNKEKHKNKTGVDFSTIDFPSGFGEADMLAEYQRWLDYRKGKRKPVDQIQFTETLKQFRTHGPEALKAAISKSIASGWQGLFVPERNHNAAGSQTGKANPSKTDAGTTLSQFASIRDRATRIPARD